MSNEKERRASNSKETEKLKQNPKKPSKENVDPIDIEDKSFSDRDHGRHNADDIDTTPGTV